MTYTRTMCLQCGELWIFIHSLKGSLVCKTSVLRTFNSCSTTTHHTPLIIHHSSYTTHHTPLIIHHSSYTTHHTLHIIHHSSYTTDHAPLIIHRSYTSSGFNSSSSRQFQLQVQISWQVQHFVNLPVQISWQVQHFVNLHVQMSW